MLKCFNICYKYDMMQSAICNIQYAICNMQYAICNMQYAQNVLNFIWKVLHRLLPTEERLARILPNSSNNCKLCATPTNADLHPDDEMPLVWVLFHTLLYMWSTRLGGKIVNRDSVGYDIGYVICFAIVYAIAYAIGYVIGCAIG
jgi:hypothetical protein